MEQEPIKILYVDDEVGNLNYFKSAFRREFKVLIASSGAEGLDILSENQDIPVILTDQRMPKMTGVSFLMKSMEILPEAIRVLVTGFSDMETVINAINHGNIYYFIHKPWSYDEMRIVIQKSLETYQLRVQNKELQLQAERQEKERISSQLIALRNQINPHFLFNCLNTLRAMIPENEDARLFIQHMSATYRYMLDHQEENFATLTDELKFAEDYVYLQQVRFRDAFRYEVRIPEETMKKCLPSGALQLLVENAIKHNAASRSKPLQVEVYSEEDFIVVQNNYQPRPEGGAESMGIGQSNLIKRLQFFTNREAEFFQQGEHYFAKVPLLDNLS